MQGLLSRLFKKREAAPVIVVSGLPRSGTSMMMKMLQAGGMALLTDPQTHAPRITEFLKIPLDTEAMIAVVNPDLYRNRAR